MTRHIESFAPGLALLALIACASESKLPAEDVAAGRVTEVIGAVHIQTPTEERELRVDDQVAGRDIIRTGADSWVRIALFHNGATWGLGPDKQRRVADSVAWRAPRGTGDSLLDEQLGPDRSVAAGRHAEREAADTRATVVPPAEETGEGEAGGAVAEGEELMEEPAPLGDEGAVATSAKGARDDSRSPPVMQPGSQKAGASSVRAAKDESASGSGATESSLAHDLDDDASGDLGARAALRLTTPGKLDDDKSASVSAPEVRVVRGRDELTQVQRGAVTAALSARLSDEQACRLPGKTARVRVAVHQDGRLELEGALPKDRELAACVQAVFRELSVRDLAIAKSVVLELTLAWP